MKLKKLSDINEIWDRIEEKTRNYVDGDARSARQTFRFEVGENRRSCHLLVKDYFETYWESYTILGVRQVHDFRYELLIEPKWKSKVFMINIIYSDSDERLSLNFSIPDQFERQNFTRLPTLTTVVVGNQQ